MGSSEPGFSTLLHPVVNGIEPHQSDNNEIDRDDKVQKNRGITRMRTPAIRATRGVIWAAVMTMGLPRGWNAIWEGAECAGFWRFSTNRLF
jgi:hypothetical protein